MDYSKKVPSFFRFHNSQGFRKSSELLLFRKTQIPQINTNLGNQ